MMIHLGLVVPLPSCLTFPQSFVRSKIYTKHKCLEGICENVLLQKDINYAYICLCQERVKKINKRV